MWHTPLMRGAKKESLQAVQKLEQKCDLSYNYRQLENKLRVNCSNGKDRNWWFKKMMILTDLRCSKDVLIALSFYGKNPKNEHRKVKSQDQKMFKKPRQQMKQANKTLNQYKPRNHNITL